MPTATRSIRFISQSQFYGSFGILLLACFALVLTGCSDGRPGRVKISGHVTVDGKPLDWGGVAFKPVEGGRMAGGGIEAGGSYFVTMYEPNDGLPPGSYTVSISSVQPINDVSQRWHAPQKYANHKTSELTVEITKATQEMDFDLTWEGDDHSEPWVEKF